MSKPLNTFVDEPEIKYLRDFLFSLSWDDTPIILHNDVILAFQQFIDNSEDLPSMQTASHFLRKVQEILHLDDRLIIVYRNRRANCRIYELTQEGNILKRLAVKDFLTIKERLIKTDLPYDQRTMELNLSSFYDYGPTLRDPDTIGNGIKHLNNYMSGHLAHQPEKWNNALYEFLKLHHLHGVQLLLDGEVICNTGQLEGVLEDAVDYLERNKKSGTLERVQKRLTSWGILDGWGNSVKRILEMMQLLQDVLEQPNGDTLEEFLARIPMVSKAAMISPHGWFGQENVLGRPDTGGQVVYILDQAKALERYLAKDIQLAGLNIDPKILIITRLIPENEGTTSDQRLEKVQNTKNVWILRVPFREHDGSVVRHWISRFRIWPYLDQFAVDVREELVKEFEGKPDLIIGNYSDGNLVATQLSEKLGVIQCNIAHALEKSKYLFSDLYWQDFEKEYNFSIQFIADMVSMNLANFIISSTRQEITGTETSIGQYESYQFFTMPGLMHVISGINLFHPRFNVIPPGVSEEIYFPYSRKKRRRKKTTETLAEVLFEIEDDESLGRLLNPDLPPIFSIARLDRIKNLTGLMEAYGQSDELRKVANLVLIASVLDPEKSKDLEEAEEIRKMHTLIEKYDLRGNIRWIGKFLSKEDTGEAYRIMADRQGIFVQPALFEAFGLTILEAMHSGLPVFATQFGGPVEIIEDNISGFLINPTDQVSMVGKLADFIEKSTDDPSYWKRISRKGTERAQKNFTWELHCKKLTRLAKVYGFWKYSISQDAKVRLSQYCHLLYELYYKERAESIRS